MNSTCLLTCWHELLQTFHRFLRSFVIKSLYHDCVTMLQTRFVLCFGKATLSEYFPNVERTVEVRMLCHTNNSEVVQNLIKQAWKLLARKHGTFSRTYTRSKGPMLRHVRKYSYHPTGQLKRKCQNENREFTADSGTSLHMVSKDAPARGSCSSLMPQSCAIDRRIS